MQPVAPSTMVRGPAALIISRMTRADSHPWQVRCPEVKYSSTDTFFTPLKSGRACGTLVKVSGMPLSSLWRLAGRPLFTSDAPLRGACHEVARHLLTSDAPLRGACHEVASHQGYSRTPSQWVLRSDFPALAAAKHMSATRETSASVTSRPPSPPMKDRSGGRLSALYRAARI